jgi:hypothetical protein
LPRRGWSRQLAHERQQPCRVVDAEVSVVVDHSSEKIISRAALLSFLERSDIFAAGPISAFVEAERCQTLVSSYYSGRWIAKSYVPPAVAKSLSCGGAEAVTAKEALVAEVLAILLSYAYFVTLAGKTMLDAFGV